MTKIQLSLTDQEAALLAGYGEKLGYNLPKVAKFFISKATEMILRDGIVPVYPMSKATEENGLQALKEHTEGKTLEIKDIDDFFKNV